MNWKLVHLTSRGLRLVGDLQHVSDDVLVVLCHGFTSNRYSRGRFPAIMQALAARGISSLAFDFAGCGESDDDVLTLEGQVADLLEVLAWARGHGYQQFGLYGHSLGGLIVLLAAARGQVQALVASGAATGPMNYDWQALYGTEPVKRLEREGVLTLPSERPKQRQPTCGCLHTVCRGDIVFEEHGDAMKRSAWAFRLALLVNCFSNC